MNAAPSRSRGTCPECLSDVALHDMTSTGSPHPVLIYPHQDGRHRCEGTYTVSVEWRAHLNADSARLAEYDAKIVAAQIEQRLAEFGLNSDDFDELASVYRGGTR